ncbi:hypothetical protein ACJRO7_027954 [Eucalyptus globulus]|uniref:CCAAT-binding factor domain-containing protein n=1 Tax=Eucalyptus globulus TaxID=34317 RepID=A0ABD3JU66_EUCGL
MFCDFLMRLYDIGEVISVMALSSLFILMMRWGLECPYFYEKLLVSCLVSTLLPAYSTATFAEKLSQVALSVLPVVALVIVAPIHNFFQCLPTINCLVHGEDGVSEVKADLKIEEQIVGNRNDSTGSDLPKKLGFNLFRNACGPSKSLTPEVPSTTKIAVKIKLMFTRLWISFFRLPLPLDVYKEVLVTLHQTVIPQLSNPIMFCDFLTRLCNIGEVISVMALSNLFTLMMQCGLEYPCFYEMLLVSCLKCLLLPAYLAAAFAKKLSRLALPVLPAVALVIVAPIHDLFQWHPTMNCLVHRLLVSFLKSPLLAAAVAKKLSPLALSVLPAGALVIVAPICNPLRLHSSITCLVHKMERHFCHFLIDLTWVAFWSSKEM